MIWKKHRLAQAICLAMAGILLWPPPFWTKAPGYVAQLSPFVAICSSLALHFAGVGTGIGLAIAVVAIFRRRWFCKYACPMGLLLDAVASIGLKKASWWARWIPLGRYIALLTIAGSAVGYPLLLWMDPLAIFSSAFAIRTAGSILFGILAGLGIGILLLLSFTLGSVWCARLCPLGGMLDLLASIPAMFYHGVKGDPITPVPAGSLSRHASGGRRSFLFLIAGAAIGLLSKRVGAARSQNALLRPPGSVEEKSFAGLCLRCSNCVRACPSGIIHQDTGKAGIAGLLSPIISYQKKYCLEDCNACTQVCPSGAIQRLDLKQKNKYVIGEALVDISLCSLALGESDCDACMRVCPFDAVLIYWDDVQYVAYPVVDRNKCNGCGACEISCPARNGRAIRVWNTGS